VVGWGSPPWPGKTWEECGRASCLLSGQWSLGLCPDHIGLEEVADSILKAIGSQRKFLRDGGH
jgi:hypothetical protein